ncbi:hypothetical protein LOAG_17483 [Loa loa]|uniref:Ras-GEF domain-containing protein n=1 Tax=Loa loa TaxID=7209 RepID=A0A1S0UIF2_LOALO|nr:hypothetical protein LOAG_17483 [Loa loa]EJD75355.1 hypothetical protein LOAG_17483 [Loa loa]
MIFCISGQYTGSISISIPEEFEEEQFENVPDLVTFYQSHNKPITRNSGCIIKNPVPNTTLFATHNFELKAELDQNYMKIIRPKMIKFGQERSLTQEVLLNETRKQLQLKALQPSSPTSLISSNGKSHLPLSDLLSRPLPKPIHSPVQEEEDDEYSKIDYDTMEETTVSTMGKDDVVSPSTSKLSHLHNHKLSLTSLNSMRNELIASSSTLSSPTTASCFNVNKLHWRMPRSDSLPVLPKRKVSLPIRDSGCIVDNPDYDQPKAYTTISTNTAIDLQNYRSPFIESNNTLQTEELLTKFKQLLLAKKPESCAQLITVEDYRLLKFRRNLQIPFKNATKFERLNGLSLILLPDGENVRNDLLERNRSLHYLCILSILHQAKGHQRCAMYDTWVQIARALFYQYGNAFSFLTLLDALCSDHVKSVLTEEYSRTLQQELESVACKLHQCEPLPHNYPQINIPFMQPLLNILSNNPSYLNDTGNNDNLWKWLQEGRHWIKQAVQFNANSSILCNEKISHGDNFLSTEFSLKLLFGTKDFSMDIEKRYDKLAAMVYAFKERCN